MEWLEFDRFLNALQSWQLALVLIASLLISVLIAVSIIYLIIRFADKRRVSFVDILFLLFKRKPQSVDSSDFARQGNTINERIDKLISTAPTTIHREADETVKFSISELLVEIEHNLKTINGFTGDNLLPLKSDVWDAIRQMAYKLPINLRGQLTRIYLEINLLNQTVQFSNVLGHRSSFLEERYRKRITTIAEGLGKIKEDIEQDTQIIDNLAFSAESKSRFSQR